MSLMVSTSILRTGSTEGAAPFLYVKVGGSVPPPPPPPPLKVGGPKPPLPPYISAPVLGAYPFTAKLMTEKLLGYNAIGYPPPSHKCQLIITRKWDTK